MLAFQGWTFERRPPLSSEGCQPDEVLRWQDPDSPLGISLLSSSGGGVYRLRVGSDLTIDVSLQTNEVTYRSETLPQLTIDHLLADLVLPRLLAQAGKFIIHAGAVRCGDRVILLMGPSGRGKSTLSTSFDRAGCPLLGDDAIIISSSEEGPVARPVYPSLRLFPDSIQALMTDMAITSPVAHYSTKQRFEVVDGRKGSTPAAIAAIFTIAASSDAEDIRLHRLSSAGLCMALVESSFALDPSDLEHARRRLDDASAMARAVPGFELHYPRDYLRLPDVRQVILDQIALLETT